uniref:Peptidase S8/S53 domain-containing protein n=1 Tax=Panagrolaimus sp. ES5 TaxID=591445 RepID=A0AC34FX09_9BILA
MSSCKNYVPKEATQQNLFLKKYPEYDGRGIKIAIIDSDVVDTSLPGFQKTSDGLPKILECFGKREITVDTSKIVERIDKDFIIGLSGRKLIIPSKWKNVSDKWHVGSVRFEKLYNLIIENGDLEMEFQKQFDKNSKSKEKLMSLKERMIDCIVWNDGQKWQACIDTSILEEEETLFSNLEGLKTLTNYDINKHEYAYLLKKSVYCINVLDDGKLLQIQYPHDEHASIVSHIAAAYFPDKSPEGNGLAPGSQILSIRWSSFVGDKVLKCLEKCIENKVDIVNFSVTFYLAPPVVEKINQMVDKHGIIITQAAGNEGPLYFSIAEQNSTISDKIFTIGSVCTAETKTMISYSENANSINSSKGPFVSSGARGVDFVAPGTAITDRPKWYAEKKRWATGTSLAAPNAAGLIACLLSALKANGIPWSPALIKMALANTAFLPNGANKLEFGNGIIQIKKAFEFIKKHYNFLPKN